MVYRLCWKSRKSGGTHRIYGNRASIREALTFILIHGDMALQPRVEEIRDGLEGEGIRDATSEFALEHIKDVLDRN